MLEIEALTHALRDAGLPVEVVEPFGGWSRVLQVGLAEGLHGALMIRESGADALEAVFTCSVTADVGERRGEIEELLALVDQAALPARLFLFRDELGFSIHGGCREADLEALTLEYVLIARRICAHVLASLAGLLDGTASRDEVVSYLDLLASDQLQGEI
jgi:hypothetical protein